MKDSKSLRAGNEVKNFVVFPDRFLVLDKDAYELILHTETLWIQASRNYCELHVQDRQKILVAHPLFFMKQVLHGRWFMRVHRSYFVNLKQVTRARGNMIYIGNIPLGQPCREEFLAHFYIVGSVKGLHK